MNLAIVWAPALVGKQENIGETPDLNQTLVATQLGTSLLSQLIENGGVPPEKKTSNLVSSSPAGTPRGHTRSRSVSVGIKEEEDSNISALPIQVQLDFQTKPLHKRRTPIRRGIPTISAPATEQVAKGAEKFVPPPLNSSASLSDILVSPRPSSNPSRLTELAKQAALPPPLVSKPARPPPSLSTPQ